MADLSYIDSTLEVKLVGQDSTGNRANYVGADTNGNMTTKDYADGPVTPGTVALASALIGGQYNTSLPTLTNTQQAAIQVDSSGRLLVGSIANSVAVTGTFWQATQPVSGTVTANQGTSPWVVSGTVTANAGTGTFAISAASLPLPTGAATAAGLTTINTTLGSPFQAGGSIGNTTFASTQSGTWNITNISGTISLPTGAATSALQTTGNTSLSTIATNTTQLAQGSTTSGELGTLIMGAVTTAAPTYTTAKTDPLSLNTSGGLRVDGSGVTQPVSGTFWQTTQPVSGTVAATQSGTWTVQPGNTQNTTAWLTQDAADGPVTPGTVASKSQLTGGQYNSTAPTLTTGQQVALQTDASGNLKVTATVVAIVFGALTTGSKSSIGTSAVQISSTSVVASSGVTLRSALANSATIYIGPSTVTANTAAATDGIPLNPGESINMPLNNLNLLYAIATATGQNIFWMVI